MMFLLASASVLSTKERSLRHFGPDKVWSLWQALSMLRQVHDHCHHLKADQCRAGLVFRLVAHVTSLVGSSISDLVPQEICW